jgi:hypothetical protein
MMSHFLRKLWLAVSVLRRRDIAERRIATRISSPERENHSTPSQLADASRCYGASDLSSRPGFSLSNALGADALRFSNLS